MKPSDFYSSHNVKYDATAIERKGFICIDVLPDLIGKPWDEVAMCYLSVLRPSGVRVTKGEMTCDAREWRVTVFINENNVITRLHQEVAVGLPDRVKCGSAFYEALKHGIDSPHCQFFNDNQISYFHSSYEGEFKVLKDGTRVKRPM